MKATEHLKKEHEAVLRMLDIMNAVALKLENGENVETGDFDAMLNFLRVFVDKCHHGKEENILFPKLVDSGIPNEGGPIGMMLYEHTNGREFIRGFAEGIARYKEGDKGAISLITGNIRGYGELLTSHIFKENNILYEMADMHLSDQEQKELLARFEQLEEEVIGQGKHEEFHKSLDKLSQLYLL
jgi:hemerythrin-like domain-containing protein